MIKNLEFTVYKSRDSLDAENFNGEFSGMAYYILHRIKKIRIPNCSYIKILLLNSKEAEELTMELKCGVLYVYGSYDFNAYVKLNKNKKLRFQFSFYNEILKAVFNEYRIEISVLDEMSAGFISDDGLLKIRRKIKGLGRKLKAAVLIIIDIDMFTFSLELIDDENIDNIEIFKSIPFYLSAFFFSAYKIEGNKIRIGSKKEAVFEIDILEKKSTIINTNKVVESLRL